MIYLFYLLVFGLVVTAAIGLFASWVDRKLTARIQYRVGPPLLQPLYDILKLLRKETLVPSGADRLTFLSVPVVGLVSVIVVSTILWLATMNPQQTFVGDVIVVLYLLLVPSISVLIGGFASGNPLASLGASRELKLILSYELPFILAILVVVIQADFSTRLGDILASQVRNGPIAYSWSGSLALAIGVICAHAKLALVPFDIPEAETEIAHGVFIEYSGAALALHRLTKNMLLATLPLLLIVLFLGGLRRGGAHLSLGVLQFLGIVALFTIIRNTNPRLRIDQAMKFFWGPVTLLAVAAVLLALGDL